MSGQGTLRIESARFGVLEVPEGRLVRFPGLPGFPDACRFAVIEHDRDSPFAWLVCADQPELAFVVTSPFQFFPDYDPPLDDRRLAALGGKAGDELEVLAIATVTRERVTLNLAAPLVIHPETRRGLQLVLDRGDWSARQPLAAAGASDAA